MNQSKILKDLISDNLVSDPNGARGRLLKEAARLFRDKGYERTTVRDLAAAVGIQSGSLFHHFRTKEEILKAVMVETIRLNTALMQAAVDAAPTSQKAEGAGPRRAGIGQRSDRRGHGGVGV